MNGGFHLLSSCCSLSGFLRPGAVSFSSSLNSDTKAVFKLSPQSSDLCHCPWVVICFVKPFRTEVSWGLSQEVRHIMLCEENSPKSVFVDFVCGFISYQRFCCPKWDVYNKLSRGKTFYKASATVVVESANGLGSEWRHGLCVLVWSRNPTFLTAAGSFMSFSVILTSPDFWPMGIIYLTSIYWTLAMCLAVALMIKW